MRLRHYEHMLDLWSGWIELDRLGSTALPPDIYARGAGKRYLGSCPALHGNLMESQKKPRVQHIGSISCFRSRLKLLSSTEAVT